MEVWEDMFINIENLKVVSILHKESSPQGKVSVRRLNGFIMRTSGTMQYIFDDKSITVNSGEMIFVPKNSRYEHKILSDCPSACTIINFEGDCDDAYVKLYSLNEFYDAEYIMNHIADLWNLGNQAEKYRCLSLLYNLFCHATNIDLREYRDEKKFDIINPGVEYLKKNIYDSSLKIERMHKLCGVSDTYFRKIFISRFGVSPKNYVMEKRISRAKSIIESGEFTTVKELALSVGYTDALYFGKVFKERYGSSPSNMSK